MKNRMISIFVAIILLIGVLPVPVLAEEDIYEVSNFEAFKAAVESINAGAADKTYTIKLTGDIDFGNSEYSCIFTKDTVILGNGHIINLGDKPKNGTLLKGVIKVEGATLSLGKEGGSEQENKLTITSSAEKRAHALMVIGRFRSKATLNIYDGVEITGSRINGATLASAINIFNGTLNMYGGNISGNINDALSGLGSAVGGDGRLGTVIFNMFGGSISDNTSLTTMSEVFGGGVLLINGQFNMSGGAINGNKIEKINDSVQESYGGGVFLWNGEAVLSGGDISNNDNFSLGGGLFAAGQANILIKNGFTMSGNTASVGGGIYNEANIVVEEGAVIANNKATLKGDDIAHVNNSLTLADAALMNATLTTDQSNKNITGWYIDDDPRWPAAGSDEVDITAPITDETYLKAAYGSQYTITYRYVSDSEGRELPQEVLDLLPVDTKEYKLGDIATPVQPEESEIVLEKGVWTFKGYDADSKTIESETTEFVGSWIFKPKKITLPDNNWIDSDTSVEIPLEKHNAYLKGYEDKTFRPENNMTREEVAAMFSRLLNDKLVDEKPQFDLFTDVKGDRWSSDAIVHLSKLGMIKGYPDNTFKPQQAITRAEFLAIVERIQPTEEGSKTFVDVPETHWAYEVVKKGASAGWIDGYPDGTFRPENNITRAEAVKIANKMLERSGDKSFIDMNKKDMTIFSDVITDHWAYYEIIEATISHEYIREKNGEDEVWKKA